MFFPFLYSLFSILPAAMASTPEFELPAIVTEGTPAEALGEDAVLPSSQGWMRGTSGTGALQGGLREKLALPISDRGTPGSYAAMIGVGRSSEDNDVQAVGVPLNFPQGGGFDLSVFPQYLWSGYRFQLGPSSGSSDPRGVAGTLTLVPWTQEALTRSDSGLRFSQVVSDSGLSQTSVAAQSGNQVAVVAGYSDGDARGPSGALSGRWGSGRVSGKYHLLATHLDVATRGSRFFPTPRARQTTTRVIPVIQADVRMDSGALLKTSVFFDAVSLRAENPEYDFVSRDQIRQVGVETAWLDGNWKWGAQARQVRFRQTAFEAPQESVGSFHVSRVWEWNHWLMEPSLQVVGVSRNGFRPAGSLGIRKELQSFEEFRPAVFARAGLNHRFPSLVDRYYVVPGFFTGNPELRPERVWSAVLGAELKGRTWETSLQGFTQLREDAQIALGVPSPFNGGLARIQSLMHSATLKPTSWFGVSHGLTWSHSELTLTGRPYPYVPRLMETVSLQIEPSRAWLFESSVRGANGRYAAQGNELPGYGWVDLGGSFQASENFQLTARIENVFNRSVEMIEGYPSLGRNLFLAFQGQF